MNLGRGGFGVCAAIDQLSKDFDNCAIAIQGPTTGAAGVAL
jgi:hypothetical protein